MSRLVAGYLGKSRYLKAKIKNLLESFQSKLYFFSLRLSGTGYKCITPRRFRRRVLFLRVGFAASELLYKLPINNVKIRAKKQKIVLFGFNASRVAQIGQQIINLRYPNVYTGKGIKNIKAVYVTKMRKQQQRGK